MKGRFPCSLGIGITCGALTLLLGCETVNPINPCLAPANLSGKDYSPRDNKALRIFGQKIEAMVPKINMLIGSTQITEAIEAYEPEGRYVMWVSGEHLPLYIRYLGGSGGLFVNLDFPHSARCFQEVELIAMVRLSKAFSRSFGKYDQFMRRSDIDYVYDFYAASVFVFDLRSQKIVGFRNFQPSDLGRLNRRLDKEEIDHAVWSGLSEVSLWFR